MSTYSSYTDIPQEPTPATLTTSYGDGATGYSTEILDVSSYDLISLEAELTPAGAEDVLDLQMIHAAKPVVAGFDPEATPPVGAWPTVAEMRPILQPTSLGADLEHSITNVAARVSGGTFRRLITLDVKGLSLIRILAKADVAGGTLVLRLLPNGPDSPLADQADLR